MGFRHLPHWGWTGGLAGGGGFGSIASALHEIAVQRAHSPSVPHARGNRHVAKAFGLHKIEDYRAHSDECRSMARRARSPEDKAMFMNMPATWESLCVDRQAHIEPQARIAKLEERAAAVPTVLLSCSIW
jgi:hypothetical protein